MNSYKFNNKVVCNNCGRNGHMYHQCKIPTTSYGIILIDNNYESISDYKLLMIQRKNTYGYIDFIRGNYDVTNANHIKILLKEMTIHEKQGLLAKSFTELWNDMWNDEAHSYSGKNEKIMSDKKFNQLRNGFINDNKEFVSLENYIKNCETSWICQEWDFPKGRRNNDENDITCATREFQEETGISPGNIKLVNNIFSLEEGFIGSNYKCYKNKFYIAFLSSTFKPLLKNFQKSEVSNLEWKTFDDAISVLRNYHLEKIDLIKKVKKLLKNYSFYI